MSFTSRSSGAIELYDLATDPDEQHDQAAKRPDEVERLMAPLRTYLGDEKVAPDRPPLGPEEIETLRALGYLE